MMACKAPKFRRRPAALENRGSSRRSPRRIARSHEDPRALRELAPPHCSQPRRERPAADNARRYREVLPLRTSEKRTIGGAEYGWFRPDIVIRQNNMRTLGHGEQGRGHGNIDILPEA